MSVCLRSLRFKTAVATLLAVFAATPLAAQTSPDAAPADQAPAGDEHAGHDMQHAAPDHAAHALASSTSREGSGTAWLPDDSPMYAFHRGSGGWQFMGHGTTFVQYLHESGARGSTQTGSINWLMGMADRGIGAGRLKFRGMMSIEPWTIGGCGYPDLLATGEVCDQGIIHDRQHPHDLFMELVAVYERPLGRGLDLQLYGGPVGEPALGPVAFMHRTSAMPNPLAPMTHHWFDSTHVTFGVATAGIGGNRWKVEGSVFNGREPDDVRTDFDVAAMDSWSGRLWVLPTRQWALQISAGYLNEAEGGHGGGLSTDVARMTASASYHRLISAGGVWASTIGWGRNAATGTKPTHAALVESSIAVADRDAWFGRFELSNKAAQDLAVPGEDTLSVAKLQGGYTRYFGKWRGVTAGLGVTVSAAVVPASLRGVYGDRVNPGYGIYLTLRPASHDM